MPALIFNQNPFIWLMKTWDSNLVRIVIVCIKKLWFLQNSSGAQKACCAWFCLGKGIKISIWVIQPHIYYRPFLKEITACSLDEIPTVTNVLPQAEARICFWDWEKASDNTFLPNFAIKALLKFVILLIPRPPLLLGLHVSAHFHWNFWPIWSSITPKELSKEESSFEHTDFGTETLDIVNMGCMVEATCITSIKMPWCTVLNVLANNAENSKTWCFFNTFNAKYFSSKFACLII